MSSPENRRQDDIQMGVILQKLASIEAKVDTLEKSHQELHDSMLKGKGMAIGLAIGAAGLGGSVGAFIHNLLK